MRPEELLRNTNNTYATLPRYADRGLVVFRWRERTGSYEIVFRTWFVRPDRFRFDWRDHHPYPPLRHVIANHFICFDGQVARWWQDRPEKVEERKSLGLAIAGATGVSLGAASQVPNLLMPDVVEASRFDQLKDLKYAGIAEVAGTVCHHLVGAHPQGRKCELWIGEEDHLIRKIATTDDRSTTEEMHEHIRTTEDIDASVFCAAGSLLDAG